MSKPNEKLNAVPEMAAAVLATSPAALKTWAQMMEDSGRFLSQRLEKDLETQKALLRCRTPQEVVKVQAAFFEDAMHDYTQEAMRMLKMMTDAGTEAALPLTSGTKRGFDDVPL